MLFLLDWIGGRSTDGGTVERTADIGQRNDNGGVESQLQDENIMSG